MASAAIPRVGTRPTYGVRQPLCTFTSAAPFGWCHLRRSCADIPAILVLAFRTGPVRTMKKVLQCVVPSSLVVCTITAIVLSGYLSWSTRLLCTWRGNDPCRLCRNIPQGAVCMRPSTVSQPVTETIHGKGPCLETSIVSGTLAIHVAGCVGHNYDPLDLLT